MKLVFELNPLDSRQVHDAIDSLKRMPGYVNFAPKVRDADDVAPVPIDTAIEEAHTETTVLTAPAAAAPPVATEADAINALRDIINRAGVAQARELLQRFDVARVSELSAESRGHFIAAARQYGELMT